MICFVVFLIIFPNFVEAEEPSLLHKSVTLMFSIISHQTPVCWLICDVIMDYLTLIPVFPQMPPVSLCEPALPFTQIEHQSIVSPGQCIGGADGFRFPIYILKSPLLVFQVQYLIHSLCSVSENKPHYFLFLLFKLCANI